MLWRLYPARVTADTVCLIQAATVFGHVEVWWQVYKRNDIFEAMAKQEGRDSQLSVPRCASMTWL